MRGQPNQMQAVILWTLVSLGATGPVPSTPSIRPMDLSEMKTQIKSDDLVLTLPKQLNSQNVDSTDPVPFMPSIRPMDMSDMEIHTKPDNPVQQPPNLLDSHYVKALKAHCGKWPTIPVQKMFRARPVKEGEFPSAVAIAAVSPDKTEVYCTGSVISKRHVLTAAHCLYKEQYDKEYNGCLDNKIIEVMNHVTLKALFGVLKANDTPKFEVPVKQAYTYKTYDMCKNMVHFDRNETNKDIAILELDEDIPFSLLEHKTIATICVAGDDIESEIRFATYGIGYDPEAEIKNLRVLQTEVLTRGKVGEECDKDIGDGYESITIVADSLCINEKSGAVSCQGDSGGPLIYKDLSNGPDGARHIAAVLSSGSSCDEIAFHDGRNVSMGAVYTQVPFHVNNGFICSVTGICE